MLPSAPFTLKKRPNWTSPWIKLSRSDCFSGWGQVADLDPALFKKRLPYLKPSIPMPAIFDSMSMHPKGVSFGHLQIESRRRFEIEPISEF